MKKLLPLFLPLLIAAAPAPEERKVAPFTDIELGGALVADVQVGKAQKVTLSGPKEMIAKLVVEVKDGELQIHPKPNAGRWMDLFRAGKGEVRVAIAVPKLSSLDAGGACTVTASGITGKAFEVEIGGASKAKLSGKVDTFTAEANGASSIDASKLSAVSARVDASGASNIKVNATKSLTAEASGASHVSYLGRPALKQEVSGASSINAD